MTDYKEGIKKEVAEVKFLIHDLRVERFINEVIHFHVTLNTVANYPRLPQDRRKVHFTDRHGDRLTVTQVGG